MLGAAVAGIDGDAAFLGELDGLAVQDAGAGAGEGGATRGRTTKNPPAPLAESWVTMTSDPSAAAASMRSAMASPPWLRMRATSTDSGTSAAT